jgi:hypothetical protein
MTNECTARNIASLARDIRLRTVVQKSCDRISNNMSTEITVRLTYKLGIRLPNTRVLRGKESDTRYGGADDKREAVPKHDGQLPRSE